jgi:hypothetical protein
MHRGAQRTTRERHVSHMRTVHTDTIVRAQWHDASQGAGEVNVHEMDQRRGRYVGSGQRQPTPCRHQGTCHNGSPASHLHANMYFFLAIGKPSYNR